MKRNLFFAASALLMGLSSCVQESLTNSESLAPVTMTVNVPSIINSSESRALPTPPEGHSLRCIMLVDYSSAEDLRIEKIATGSEVMVLSVFLLLLQRIAIPVISGLTILIKLLKRQITMLTNIIQQPIWQISLTK